MGTDRASQRSLPFLIEELRLFRYSVRCGRVSDIVATLFKRNHFFMKIVLYGSHRIHRITISSYLRSNSPRRFSVLLTRNVFATYNENSKIPPDPKPSSNIAFLLSSPVFVLRLRLVLLVVSCLPSSSLYIPSPLSRVNSWHSTPKFSMSALASSPPDDRDCPPVDEFGDEGIFDSFDVDAAVAGHQSQSQSSQKSGGNSEKKKAAVGVR